MNLNNADEALKFLYAKYFSTKTNIFLPKSPREIVQEPYLRNFYAGIKPSSFQYLYPQFNSKDNDASNNFEINIENQKHVKAYRKPIKDNKRLCPWHERKILKHRNNTKKHTNNKIKKYSSKRA